MAGVGHEIAARLALTWFIFLLPLELLLLLGTGPGFAEDGERLVVPSPPTIADITAILDKEKPDPKVIAQLHAAADADPPSGAERVRLAQFHYDRCQARFLLGESRNAIADCERAVQLGKVSSRLGPSRAFFKG